MSAVKATMMFIATGLVLISMVVCVVVLLNVCWIPKPRLIRLGEATNMASSFSFQCPKGLGFALLVGTPRDGAYSPHRGSIVLETPDRQTVLTAPMGSNQMTRVSWLLKEGLAGIVLAGSGANVPDALNACLIPGERYVAKITLRPVPPEGSSFWLFYFVR